MTTTVPVPDYVKNLTKPNDGGNPPVKRAWSIDVQNVWVPFFTATNVTGQTEVPSEDLGAPVRLAKGRDGSIRFSQNGRPSTRIAPELNKHIKMVQANFIGGLVSYTGQVMEQHEDEYRAEVAKGYEAAKPIHAAEEQELQQAIAEMEKAAQAEAAEHGESVNPPTPESEQAPTSRQRRTQPDQQPAEQPAAA